jgi:hypothetical protein
MPEAWRTASSVVNLPLLGLHIGHEIGEAFLDQMLPLNFALPQNKQAPSLFDQQFIILGLTLSGRRYLRIPKLAIRFRLPIAFFTSVAVPKTAMHEYRFALPDEDNVRPAW